MRPSVKVRAELATTIRCNPDAEHAIRLLLQEYKASRAAEYLQQIADSFPPLAPEQISELQDVLARASTRTLSQIQNTAEGKGTKNDEFRGHGRSQWDAMTEAISEGRFRGTRLALLILVRYGPRTGAGALITTLAYKLTVAVLGHHH